MFFSLFFFFFFNDTATTEIYTLSLHDALPISIFRGRTGWAAEPVQPWEALNNRDRKSTRLNSSHLGISYAVFCLKKKKKKESKINRYKEETHGNVINTDGTLGNRTNKSDMMCY